MVGLPYDCLANPLGAVRFTFEKAIASGSDPTAFDCKDWGALELFRDFLFNQGGLSQVPILNNTTLNCVQPNTLIRFRGMIQDMLPNEFYVGAYKDGSTWRTNKFTDIPQCPMDTSPDMRIWERRLLYCVPVPGQNSWTLPSSGMSMNQCVDGSSQLREKRQRVDNESDQMDVADEGIEGSPFAKKMRENGHLSESSQLCGSSTVGGISSMVSSTDRDALPCLIKIYDSTENELKLNDVFEFVGVFTLDLEPSTEQNESECNDFFEDALVHMPASKVPRLHCLIHRKLGVDDFLNNFPVEPKPNLFKEIRQSLLSHLLDLLGNDTVAAEFLLLHLVSKVHARVDTLAVGKLSLNFTCFNKESMSVFGTKLSLGLKNLLPFTHIIPLTVGYLNTASLAPKKDYQTNRLQTGALQLAEGSHLIVDETQLEAGTLNSIGVENTRLLKNLMEYQKVEYDFEYYKMEMATDVQVLVFSEGKSNILPADVVLPFRPCSVGSAKPLAVETFEAWRWYLATVRSLPHFIESEMEKVVENDLVTARQADRSLGSQDLSRWLTMGRLVSASYGETSLSSEHWEMVKDLERLRKERLG